MKWILIVSVLVFSYFGWAEEESSSISSNAKVNADLESSPSSEDSSQGPEPPSLQSLQIKDNWVAHRPFVPEKFDYYFELGAMWEKRNMYWIGGGFGRHVGRCFLTESQSCQQYWDLFGGVGGRDGLTSLLFLTGPRWQFVHFPKHYSPSIRLFAGLMNIRDDLRDKEIFAYGVGYGWTMSVHERVDMRLEARVGNADEIWYQSMVSVHVKMDRWVDYFGAQLKKFGLEAVKTTGGMIKKTGDAISDVLGGGSNKQSSETQKKE